MPTCDPNANAYDENNMRDIRIKIGVLHIVSIIFVTAHQSSLILLSVFLTIWKTMSLLRVFEGVALENYTEPHSGRRIY